MHQAQRVLEEVDHIKLLAAQGKNQLVGAAHGSAPLDSRPVSAAGSRASLHKRAPEMPLEIEENLTVNPTAMLKGKPDVIMTPCRSRNQEFWVQALYDEPFKAVVPADHRLAKRGHRSSAMTGERLASHAGHCFRHQVLEARPNSVDRIPKACRGIR